MTRIRKSMAGSMPVFVPDGKGTRRGLVPHRPAPNWGWLAWVATSVGAFGLLAWRVLALLHP